MQRLARPTGWANPRARPFVGWHVNATRLYQLYGVKVNQRRARRNGGDLGDFPPILQLQTKSGCNAECIICPQRKIKDMFPPATISDELYRSVVEQCAREPNFKGLGFVLQNEPLTDPTLFDKIRYFRERVAGPAMTFLVTNGTLLTPELAPVLLASGLDAMHVSCNGWGKEDFEAVNRGKSFDVWRRNLEHFLDQDLSRLAVMLSFVRSNLYRAEMDRAIREWRARGLTCFVHGVNNRAGLVEGYEQFEVPLAREPLFTRLRKRFMQWFLGCCPYPFIQMSVLASGTAIVCTHDWSRKQVIGDLNTQSIREVWNGPVMREVRMKLLRGELKAVPSCVGCDVFDNATFA